MLGRARSVSLDRKRPMLTHQIGLAVVSSASVGVPVRRADPIRSWASG